MDEKTSLDDVMARARHVQNAIRGLSLERIEAHDPQALRKLDQALVVLDRLVEPAEPAEPAPTSTTISPQPDDNPPQRGLGHRLGRVFMPGGVEPMVRLTDMPHRDGLPAFEKCVAPNGSPIDGAHGIFVTSTTVFSAVLPQPYASSGWQVLKMVRCENQKAVIETVMAMLRG